ncbi:MAG: ATP-binding protein [Clostridia bacterium]|jgi:predicted AAA+ superfamily ATPase
MIEFRDEGREKKALSSVVSLVASLKELIVLREILKEKPVICLFEFCNSILENEADYSRIAEAYHEWLASLIRFPRGGFVTDKWKDVILTFLLLRENPFSAAARTGKPDRVIWKAMHRDLFILEELFRLDNRLIKEWCKEVLPPSVHQRVEAWMDWSGEKEDMTPVADHLKSMVQKLSRLQGWDALIQEIWDFHRKYGCGDFVQYRAFRWSGERGLEAIPSPDPIRMEDLVGYESQKKELIHNTERFLAALPANNVLLYGDRGTGKSSMVKALIHYFHKENLCLVELGRDDLKGYLPLIEILRKQPNRFILFIDDLSFEDNETEYKSLKALLEGGIASRPSNVLIYATSNRRHLIKETFNDRGPEHLYNAEEEIFRGDALQEKRSLSDRFGITLTFLAPDRDLYIHMIEKMLKKEGMHIPKEELIRKATQWEMRFNGKSGRAARQFVNMLIEHPSYAQNV